MCRAAVVVRRFLYRKFTTWFVTKGKWNGARKFFRGIFFNLHIICNLRPPFPFRDRSAAVIASSRYPKPSRDPGYTQRFSRTDAVLEKISPPPPRKIRPPDYHNFPRHGINEAFGFGREKLFRYRRESIAVPNYPIILHQLFLSLVFFNFAAIKPTVTFTAVPGISLSVLAVVW